MYLIRRSKPKPTLDIRVDGPGSTDGTAIVDLTVPDDAPNADGPSDDGPVPSETDMSPSTDAAPASVRPAPAVPPVPGTGRRCRLASALRCILDLPRTPALAPTLGVSSIVAVPTVLAASALSIGTAVYAIRSTVRAGDGLSRSGQARCSH